MSVAAAPPAADPAPTEPAPAEQPPTSPAGGGEEDTTVAVDDTVSPNPSSPVGSARPSVDLRGQPQPIAASAPQRDTKPPQRAFHTAGAATPEVLRWISFQLPELRGLVPPNISALVEQILAQPTLPFRFCDAVFVASLNDAAPAFLPELFRALVRRAQVGVSAAVRLLTPLIGVLCMAFGRDAALQPWCAGVAPMMTVEGCLASLDGCQQAIDASALGAVLMAHALADAVVVAQRTKRFCRTLCHAADQWSLASAACVAAMGINESNELIRQRRKGPATNTSAAATPASGHPTQPSQATESPPDLMSLTTPRTTAAGVGGGASTGDTTVLTSGSALDVSEPSVVVDASTVPLPSARQPATQPTTPATPRVAPPTPTAAVQPKVSQAAPQPSATVIDFPSKVPNTPHPAAIATVCTAVLVFRVRQQHTPVLTTVNWLNAAMRSLLTSLEANADALSIGPSMAHQVGLGRVTASSAQAPPMPGGGSMAVHGMGFVIDAATAQRVAQSQVSATPSASGKAAAPRPDRPGVEVLAASLSVAAVALTSIMRRRGASKLNSPEGMRLVPHPNKASNEAVNIHDATAYLALRGAAVLLEAKSRGRQRYQWCAAELEEAPVALLHLANAAIDCLVLFKLGLSTETQRQLAATLGALLRASDILPPSLKTLSTAAPSLAKAIASSSSVAMPPARDSSPNVDESATQADVTRPSASFAMPSPSTSATVGGLQCPPEEATSCRRALAFALRCVDALAHTHGPVPQVLVTELGVLKRQLEMCEGNAPAFVARRAEVAIALANCPASVWALAQERQASPNPDAYLPVLLGWIPCDKPRSQDAPLFHADHALWALSVVAKVFSGAAAGVVSRASVAGSLMATLNTGVCSAGVVSAKDAMTASNASSGASGSGGSGPAPAFKGLSDKANRSTAANGAAAARPDATAWRKSRVVPPGVLMHTGCRTAAITDCVRPSLVALSEETRKTHAEKGPVHFYPVVAAALVIDDSVGQLEATAVDAPWAAQRQQQQLAVGHVDPTDALFNQPAATARPDPSPPRAEYGSGSGSNAAGFSGGAGPGTDEGYDTDEEAAMDMVRLPPFMRPVKGDPRGLGAVPAPPTPAGAAAGAAAPPHPVEDAAPLAVAAAVA